MVHIAVLSGLGLFLELLLIRWTEAQVRQLVYVKNLPLIASFLGLGIGFAVSRGHRTLFPLSVFWVSAVLIVGVFFGHSLRMSIPFGPSSPESHLGTETATSIGQLVTFSLVIAMLFGLIVIAMVPFGQVTGRLMEGVTALRAYTVNVAGSLGGILLFFLLASLRIPPWILAGLCLGVTILYQKPSRLLQLVSALTAGLACAGMAPWNLAPGHYIAWSPYNKIEVEPEMMARAPNGESFTVGWLLRAQNTYYQHLLNLSDAFVSAADDPDGLIKKARYAYDYPYRWRRPHHVLVLGAGTGNDVASALRHGAERVDAVEIDSSIVGFGKKLHPEHPYDDPRAHVIVADARAFLKRPGENYDLVVFGLLDAHLSYYSSLSSSIRLDNYVYTVESFRSALRRLTPNGLMAVSVYIFEPWMATRLESMLREASGQDPIVRPIYYDDAVVYLVGPGLAALDKPGGDAAGLPAEARSNFPPGPSARDDWPFLYLKDRLIPPTVLWASAGVFLVTLILVRAFFRQDVRFDRHLFFLGAGFLLLETRTIAQLGLLFGATWRVSAITIGAILTLILIVNLVVAVTGPLRPTPLYLGLGFFLILNHLIPPSAALGGGALAATAMTCFLALPFVCAALIFASTLGVQKTGLAPMLASNLIGSVLGGILENVSMVVGISALSIVAVVVYAASFRRS